MPACYRRLQHCEETIMFIAALAGFSVLAAVWLAGPAIFLYRENQRDRMVLASIIAAVAMGSLAFRLITGVGLQQSAALFIGIPTLLAIAAVFSPTPRSAVGVACKSVTVGLLVSLILLGEGVLCVAMSAPLFYFVAVLIGKGLDDGRAGRNHMHSWIALMAMLPMSMEGVTPLTTIARTTTVSETRIVQTPAADIAAAIVSEPRFDRALPRYLSMGFPRPTSTHYDGHRWVIRMRGGEMRLNGMEPRAGDLILDRDGEGPGFISWKATSDDSHMRHFLTWESSRVEWTAIDAQTTRVTWTLTYRRDLDPAWYFGPMERYAVHLAAGYLIDAVATP
jgi:hypothetical protein